MRQTAWIALLSLAVPLSSRPSLAEPPAGDAPPASQAADANAPARGELDLGGVTVDLRRRQVRFVAEVVRRYAEGAEPPAPARLEVFVSKWQQKTHETVLHTKAKGWKLHAALLSLGLSRGKPAKWTYDIDAEKHHYYPPRGAKLDVRLRWTQGGQVRTARASSWLASASGKGRVPDKWVFVGSDMLPGGGYAADANYHGGGGAFISVANFAEAIIDVPFLSTADNAQLDIESVPGNIPPIGTQVEVILIPEPNAAKAEHARKLVEIDRYGRIRVEGRKGNLTGDELADWASAYISRHDKGMAVLRADARALVDDVRSAWEELWIGGVKDIEVERVIPGADILPRTPEQARHELETWDKKFSEPHEYIADPGPEARGRVEQARRELRRLEAKRKLLEKFIEDLDARRKAYEDRKPPEPSAGASGS